VQAVVAAAERHFGKLDILFNCAGGSVIEDAPLGEVDVATVWDKTMRLDLYGTMLCCHHAIPAIVSRGGGAVINMSSARPCAVQARRTSIRLRKAASCP